MSNSTNPVSRFRSSSCALFLLAATVLAFSGAALCSAQDHAVLPDATKPQAAAPAVANTPIDNAHRVDAENHGAASTHGGGEHAAHALPAAAPVLYHGLGGQREVRDAHGAVVTPAKFGPFAVTNSMFVTWIVAILIILFARYATQRIREVPDGAQNFWEFLVEGLRNFLEGIIGRDLTRKTFWFFATLFIFILFTNWFGLLPGVGTIGWGTPDAHGAVEHISRPLFRGTNADLNMTLAMAMIFFGCWIVWALQSNGFGGFLLHIFGPKGDTKGWMKYMMIVVFAVVGVLEIVSILFRPVSLSFRLYGNVFAGESMLEKMATLVPAMAPIIPIPFYFMELLVGLVQALVFMLLTAVFTLLICSHGDDHHSEPHAHDPHEPKAAH